MDQFSGMIWGGTRGGPCPVQRSGDGAILFSYGQSTISQTVAINQALSGTGIQVRGYDYSWTIKNANAGSGQAPAFDPLQVNVSLYDAAKQQVESRTHDYSFRIDNWTTFSGTEEFANRYSLANLSDVRVNITSRDAGYWAGYYGPEINNINFRLRYSVDQCAANPLSSPDCPGYAEAYKTQQCTANPLFHPSCPGYEVAFFTQQCTVNTLYSPGCPGYAQAYFNQQCSINPLYNNQCPGYAQAYFNQQCTNNPLYDKQCPLYESAFLAKQCESNPLYSTQCPTYQQAYFNQQCSLNALYNNQCPGYQQAYQAKLQADACKANPQSNMQCPGFAPVVVMTQSIQSPVTIQQDPVATVTQTPLTSDPIVNQTIAPAKEPAKESSTSPSPALGSGLVVPGVRIQPQPTTSQTRGANIARQTVNNAQAIAADAQTQQQDVAVASMGTVPGFDTYQSAILPDAQFYQVRDIYRGNVIRDNARAQRALSQRSDRLHKEMVDEQYRR